LLVVRHGYLVSEKYFGRGNREALPELIRAKPTSRSADQRHQPGVCERRKANVGHARFRVPGHIQSRMDMRAPLIALVWRGACDSYATTSPRLASIVLRNLTGMEMEDYVRLRLTVHLVSERGDTQCTAKRLCTKAVR
jgi:hypothetical protein